MKTSLIGRFIAVAVLSTGFALAMAGCEASNSNRVAGSSGTSAERGAGSSGGGTGGHTPATNQSHVGPTNAGPAGSQ